MVRLMGPSAVLRFEPGSSRTRLAPVTVRPAEPEKVVAVLAVPGETVTEPLALVKAMPTLMA